MVGEDAVKRRHVVRLVMFFFLFISTSIISGCVEVRDSPKLIVKETVLARIREEMLPYSLVLSRDMRHLGFVAACGDMMRVVVDGRDGKVYDRIGDHVVCSDEVIEPYSEWRDFLPAFMPKGLVLSPDGKRVAYKVWQGQKEAMVVDGREGKRYDEIDVHVFSPDSKHLAYKARRGKKWLVVLGGVEGDQFDVIDNLVFSPDGKRLAYAAGKGEKKVVVVDGQEGKEYDGIDGPIFSRNGKRIAYRGRKDGKVVIIMDGRVIGEYDHDDKIFFITKNMYVSFTGRKDGKWFIRACKDIDTLEGILEFFSNMEEHFEAIDHLALSPDGKRLAYTVWKDKKVVVVVDGREGKKYEVIGGLAFSPDGKRLAYVAGRNKKVFLVVDGMEGKEYDSIGDLTFSPDGKRIAYEARKGEKAFIVIDGRESRHYDFAGGIVFSRDSKHIIYRADKDEKSAVVKDNREGRWYCENIFVDKASSNISALSPDGKCLAYVATRDKEWEKWCVVVNGRESDEYTGVLSVAVSPNGKHVAHVAWKNKKLVVVVDGREIRGYDGIVEGSRLVFDGPNRLHFLAEKGGQFLMVEVEIVKK